LGSSVVAFPLSRRQNLVSDIADVLRTSHGEAANAAWRETAKRLLSSLKESGIDARAAEAEVRGLLYAALAEIRAEAVTASA
jgi:hypothetical protein